MICKLVVAMLDAADPMLSDTIDEEVSDTNIRGSKGDNRCYD